MSKWKKEVMETRIFRWRLMFDEANKELTRWSPARAL